MLRKLIPLLLLGLAFGNAQAAPVVNSDWGDMPTAKAEKCMDFWEARGYEVSFEGSGKDIYCAVVVPELGEMIPDREAQALLRREAQSLRVKVSDLTDKDIFRLFTWKYKVRGFHEQKALEKSGMSACQSNPHQDKCRK